MSKTIDYYNSNADEFFENTVNTDMSAQYEMFEKYLKAGSRILDCGCGSGRDTKHFLEEGYSVEAIDGSEEMCDKASNYTGIEVRRLLFQEIDYLKVFDGVWACASLLHLSREVLPKVLDRLEKALKSGGILYASFKYGDFYGERNGRLFTDLNEVSFEELINDVPGLALIETSLSIDSRRDRDEQWLNVVCKKI